MKLNLIPIRDEKRNCFEDAIVSIVNWFKKDYELLFSTSWYFKLDWKKFCENKDKKTSDYFLKFRNEYFTLLEKYCGIQGERVEKNNENLIDIIINELKLNRPVLANIDVYWCHWFKREYKTDHYLHSTIIIGYDEETNKLCCADALPYNLGEYISIEEFLNGCQNIYKFSVLEKENNDIDLNLMLINNIKEFYEEKSFNSFELMKKFGEYIQNSIDLKYEVEGYEKQLWNSKLFTNLHSLGQGRRNFANTLKYLVERYNRDELIPIYEYLDEAGLRWSSVRGIIAKAYYSKESNMLLQRAGVKVCELADFEEKIKDEILKILKGNRVEEEKVNMSNINLGIFEEKECTLINIEKYFNNNAFAKQIDEECISNFSGNGAYYLYDDKLIEDELICDKDIKFDIKKISQNENDNISCLGQQIEISKVKSKYIVILGAAEWGNHLDKLHLYYEGKMVKELIISFSDWFFEPVFGEKIAWIGKGAERRGGKLIETMVNVRLFYKVYSLDSEIEFDKIVLPDYPNIHIFSIALI